MYSSVSSKRSPLIFIALVFALSLVFWLLMALLNPLIEHLFSSLSVAIPAGFNPVSAIFGGYMSLIAACILVSREKQPGGVNRLLQRVFDLKRIRQKLWYVPVLLLNPLIYVLTYVAMLLLGLPLSAPSIAWLMLPLFFVVFFIEAIGEEVGWMGYLADSLQGRWGALQAGLILGVITAIWHIIPGLQAHQALSYIAWQGLCDVAWRILILWFYNNTGKSLFAIILFHDMYNVAYVFFPVAGSYYNPTVAFPIMAAMALIVLFLWGPKTLARYRYTRTRVSPEGDEAA